jgi:hypothetical protein
VVNLAPVGGILWVNGKVKIDGDGVINGCIIATKEIKIKGDVTQVKYGDYPALVSREKKIEIDGCGTYHGLIYAPKGDVKIKKKGTGSITGSIIAGKKFKGEGSWSFLIEEDSTPAYPDGTRIRNESEIVYISAWHR